MRPGTTPEITAALAEAGITTALLARLDFKSGTVCAWTGGHSIKVTGWADSLLNDQTFHPLENGVIVDIGDNSFSYSGSEALEIALGCAFTWVAEWQTLGYSVGSSTYAACWTLAPPASPPRPPRPCRHAARTAAEVRGFLHAASSRSSGVTTVAPTSFDIALASATAPLSNASVP